MWFNEAWEMSVYKILKLVEAIATPVEYTKT